MACLAGGDTWSQLSVDSQEPGPETFKKKIIAHWAEASLDVVAQQDEDLPTLQL